MNNATLKLDWCGADAARFACENWHYSRRVPVFKTSRIGVGECGAFIGAVIFGCGGTPEIGSPFGLKQTEVAELCRVALRSHATPVTRIVAIALKMLKRQSPGLRLIVSFADEGQNHVGGIYQAGNWIYLGAFEHHAYRVRGELVHPKTLHSRYGKGGQSVPWLRVNVDPKAERVPCVRKHKYVMPLDDDMRVRMLSLKKPYPKRAGSIVADAMGHQPIEGGSLPTPALSPKIPQEAGA